MYCQRTTDAIRSRYLNRGTFNAMDLRDARRYWKDCYVKYSGGKGVKIYRVNGIYGLEVNGECITVMEIHNLKSVFLTIDVRHPNLNLSTPKLGYFNRKDNVSCVYIARRVNRTFKQGLHANNIDIKYPFETLLLAVFSSSLVSGALSRDATVGGLRAETFLYHHGLDTPYPTLSAALHMLNSGTSLGVAISKDFAFAYHPITGEISILYTDAVIGRLVGGTYELKPDYIWLSDTLEEVFSYA